MGIGYLDELGFQRVADCKAIVQQLPRLLKDACVKSMRLKMNTGRLAITQC